MKTVLLKEDPNFQIESLTDEHKPDLVISSLSKLLDIFQNTIEG